MLIILAVTFLHHSYITHFSHIHHFGTIDINQVYNISLYLQFSFFVAVTTSQKNGWWDLNFHHFAADYHHDIQHGFSMFQLISHEIS